MSRGSGGGGGGGPSREGHRASAGGCAAGAATAGGTPRVGRQRAAGRTNARGRGRLGGAGEGRARGAGPDTKGERPWETGGGGRAGTRGRESGGGALHLERQRPAPGLGAWRDPAPGGPTRRPPGGGATPSGSCTKRRRRVDRVMAVPQLKRRYECPYKSWESLSFGKVAVEIEPLVLRDHPPCVRTFPDTERTLPTPSPPPGRTRQPRPRMAPARGGGALDAPTPSGLFPRRHGQPRKPATCAAAHPW